MSTSSPGLFPQKRGKSPGDEVGIMFETIEKKKTYFKL